MLASIGFDVRKVGWLRCMDLGVDPESENLAPILTVDASNLRACSEYSVNNVSFAIVITRKASVLVDPRPLTITFVVRI